MRPHLLQAALLVLAAFGLLVALNLIASADSPVRQAQPGQCFGAHGWVNSDGTGYSVADDVCPEDLRP